MTDGIKRRVAKAIKLVYPRFGLRDTDVILASYPKSGNTWVRFIWANILSIEETNGGTVDFNRLVNKLGSEYDSHSYRDVDSSEIPRLVKTHRQYDKRRFEINESVYIIRNPFDVMESYHEYRRHKKSASVSESLSTFIRGKFGIEAWCTHVKSWMRSDAIILRFEDLKKDAYEAFKQAFSEGGLIDVENKTMKRAVEESTFENLRRLEELYGRPNQEMFNEGFRFMRTGSIGTWKSYSDSDLTHIEDTIKAFNLDNLYNIHNVK